MEPMEDPRVTYLQVLQHAFQSRRLLTYREGELLVVNDPYLRDRVVVAWNGRWWFWEGPAGNREYRDEPRDVVDSVIEQFAGIYYPPSHSSAR
ncbi:hypothetical protein [Nocardiopsis suaedae]|uniref:Immunity protein 35 domain-containing protein n=1 Tax=Nocardiopsis suaedae TaxID=3018444 RepID=A0ABT4TTI7_9ACTN|nr:hypothetical protein [Nocardiopsis suaedae]MDA2808005.1 hypothetical protein [Nocardiopsis suaedae]